MADTEDSGLEKVSKQALDRANKMAGQLGTWTMLGNAAGLGFILTTAKDGRFPSGLPIELAYGTFLTGMILAFVGHFALFMTISQIGAMATDADRAFRGLDHREKMRELLSKSGKPIPDEYEADDAKDNSTIEKKNHPAIVFFAVVGILSYIASVAMLGYGLHLPLAYGLR